MLDINKNIIIFTGYTIDINSHNKYITIENTFSKEIFYINEINEEIKIYNKDDFINNKGGKYKQVFKWSVYSENNK